MTIPSSDNTSTHNASTDNTSADALQPALAALADALARELRQRLVSLIVYGSAARGLYQPGFSDVNLLLVLDAADLPALRTTREAFAAADRSGIARRGAS